jgi:peptidyl-prolyl cis-trans isomerase A (cyclophilin A)
MSILARMGILWLLMAFTACQAPHPGHPQVEIKTSLGSVLAELYPDKAPKTVAAFLNYVDSGFYKNGSFYRVLTDENQPSNAPKSELIQGGIWKSNYKKLAGLPGIPHESTRMTGILHKNGVLSMARREPGTATTEFFICLGDQPGFDFGGENNPDGQGYAAFGKVIKGMDIVWKIYQQTENNQSFDPPVPILRIIKK